MPFRRILTAVLLAPSIALTAQTPRVLTITRDVHIDAAVADLSPIRGVALSPSGDLLLSQRQDQLIRVFSAVGSKPSIGSKGEGPGEFARINGIGFTRDTLWVTDIANDRISFFAGPGYKFTRSVKMPVVMPLVNGVNPDIELDVQTVLSNGDLRAEANHSDYPKHLPAWFTGADTGSTVLVRTSIDGGFRNRLAVMPGSKCLVIFPIGNGRGGAEIPFCMDQLSTAASGGESVLFSSVETPGSVRVTLVNADGVMVADLGRRDLGPDKPVALSAAKGFRAGRCTTLNFSRNGSRKRCAQGDRKATLRFAQGDRKEDRPFAALSVTKGRVLRPRRCAVLRTQRCTDATAQAR